MNILIVDDVPINLKLLRTVLEGDDHRVVDACDGLQALAELKRENFDVVISDILMPHMDGYRLCQEVRRSSQWRQLPFIFYTATYISPSDEKLCYDLGGDKYVRKPATRTQIQQALRDVTAHDWKRPSVSTAAGDEAVMREYNERLVCKLEEKNQQLEHAQSELQQVNQELEWRVQQRTAELKVANEELESFCSSVSHDLRAPIRHINGFVDIVLRECADKLDETHLKHLRTVRNASNTMSQLIDALLELSKVTRAQIRRSRVDLTALAREIISELSDSEPKRVVRVEIAPGMFAEGDPILLRVVLVNLLGNAWKFTRKKSDSRIEFGFISDAGGTTYLVRDNGAGFDMNYAKKLFHAFQRLHGAVEFEGTGVGLATVQRIIHRHNGTIRAEAVPQQGATFYFTLNNAVSNPQPLVLSPIAVDPVHAHS